MRNYCEIYVKEPTRLTRDHAFHLLFRPKTFESVCRWLVALGVPSRDLSDLAQDVLLAAFESFHSYEPQRTRPERWLNGIAVHVAGHYRDLARHRRERLTRETFHDLPGDQRSPDEHFATEETRDQVYALLFN